MSEPITTPDIYKPPGTITLDTQDYNFQRRIGLQGPGGTGKTHSTTTWPNLTCVSFNRGLVSHIGRKDIIEVPFYDDRFCDSIVKRAGLILPPNRKESLIKWLSTEALELTKNQTLSIDAGTDVQAAYHQWWEVNKEAFITYKGEIDHFKEWRLKVTYFSEIMIALKSLRCDVFYIVHESPDRDDKGNLTGGVRPLLTGQFQDELQTHFTDWFRVIAFPKPDQSSSESAEKFRKHFNLTVEMAAEWLASGTKETMYVFQTQSDSVCKCKTSLFNCPKYILADYKTFCKYTKRNETIKS